MKRVLSLFLLLALVVTALPVSASARTQRVPIYVGDLAVDYMAQQILADLDLEGKSDYDQILTVYDWIIENGERYEWDGEYRFDATEVRLASQGSFARTYQEQLSSGRIMLRKQWEDISGFCGTDYFGFSLDSNFQVIAQAYDMMLKMTGSCASFTTLFTVLLGHLGYDSRIFHGMFINMDGTQVEHTWNYVLIDGTWYWMDIRIDHSIGGGSHQYFMKEDTDAWALEHIWPQDQSDWLAEHTEEIAAIYADASLNLPEEEPDVPDMITPEDPEVPAEEPDASGSLDLICSIWAAEQMKRAYDAGLIPQCLLGKDLRQSITREEFAAVAMKLYTHFTGFEMPEYEGQPPFTDTTDPEVLKAYQLGIVNGMGDGTFAPYATLTREQASAMLGRVYELTSQGTIFGGTFLPQSLQEFTDHAEIFDYAKNYIYFFTGAGIIDGMGDGTFAPKGTMTREQALKIVILCAENL